MDKIDDVDFDVDGGYGESGNQTKAFLILEGDFVNTFEHYLENDRQSSITLEIDRTNAEKLCKTIYDYLDA